MTYSLVVREPIESDDEHDWRFGVAVTTNNPGIGVFCPAVSEQGAVAAQYLTHGNVGPHVLRLIEDAVPATDALSAALGASPIPESLQVHALCEDERAYHSGAELESFHEEEALEYGERSGSNWSAAGNCLDPVDTLDAMADAYVEADRDRRLGDRLISALEAGEEAGGDGRDIDARSGAIKVVDPTAPIANEWYNDLRVDATGTPVPDLRTQYEMAWEYHETASDDW